MCVCACVCPFELRDEEFLERGIGAGGRAMGTASLPVTVHPSRCRRLRGFRGWRLGEVGQSVMVPSGGLC